MPLGYAVQRPSAVTRLAGAEQGRGKRRRRQRTNGRPARAAREGQRSAARVDETDFKARVHLRVDQRGFQQCHGGQRLGARRGVAGDNDARKQLSRRDRARAAGNGRRSGLDNKDRLVDVAVRELVATTKCRKVGESVSLSRRTVNLCEISG